MIVFSVKNLRSLSFYEVDQRTEADKKHDRDRQTNGQTDNRQTDRQSDLHTYRQTQRQTDNVTGRHSGTQTGCPKSNNYLVGSQAGRGQTYRQTTDKQEGRQTCKQTGRLTATNGPNFYSINK